MADKKISALTAATTPLAGTEVLPIVQSGATVKVSVANLTAGRAVGMAGGSFTDNLTQSTAAKGINFTANTAAAGMTSQLLNWYEEGTWTPDITFGGGSTGVTYSSRVARYTRIGREVFCEFDVRLSSKGSSTGNINISVPFYTNATVFSAGIVTYFTGSATVVGLPSIVTNANSYTANFYFGNAGAMTQMTDTHVTDTSIILGSFSYTV